MAGETVLAKLAVQIAANTAEFNNALARTEGHFKSFTSNINRLAIGVGASFGFAQVFAGVQNAFRSISEFESKLSTVKAITGATQKEFEQLRASALKLGASTKFTASQVADLQTEFGRVGFSTGEILAATKATLLLATATGEDLAKSADVAGSTIRGFGLDASETGRVADVMAESFNATALSLENFSEAMKYVAPIASQAGISLEETTALLGTLADAGIRGSQAGTSLRKIITDLGGESGTLSEKLQKLADKGLTGADAMSEVGRTAYASLLILAKNTEKTNELSKAFENSAGAAQKAADIMSDNLTGDVVKLTSAYDGLVQSAGSSNSILREFVQTGTAVLNSLNSNNGALGEFISGWLRLVSVVPRAVGTAVRGLSQLFSGLKGLTQKEVQEALVFYKGLRDAAIAAGDQDAVKRATQSIADLTSMYGLLRDKAVEFKDENNNISDSIDKVGDSADKTSKKLEKLRQINPIKDNSLIDVAKKYNNAQEEIRKYNDEIQTFLVSVSQLAGFKPIADLPDKLLPTDAMRKAFEEAKAIVTKGREDLRKEVADIGPMIANGIAGIADALGTALGSGNFKDFGKGLLEAVASFAQQLGSLMIASGIAQVVLKSGNPIAMVAAGAALVAAGAAIKATLAKQSNLPKATFSSGSGSGVSSSTGNLTGAGQEIKVSGEFRIDGNDLVYIFNRQNQLNSRTR